MFVGVGVRMQGITGKKSWLALVIRRDFPGVFICVFDYRFDYQTMYFDVLECIILHLSEGIRKTPVPYIAQGF